MPESELHCLLPWRQQETDSAMLEKIPDNPFPRAGALFYFFMAAVLAGLILLAMKYFMDWSSDVEKSIDGITAPQPQKRQ